MSSEWGKTGLGTFSSMIREISEQSKVTNRQKMEKLKEHTLENLCIARLVDSMVFVTQLALIQSATNPLNVATAKARNVPCQQARVYI